ncbi:hypothetical protein AX774_g2538 [Zancudomyces culisetae]|nr:hypothetical protein AX774_g2538 [Zancudomyces culisetae]|eukprot:OMH83946.1 hypothetical protein AX774_g2538 [Zancudomyces culisetae]
MENEFMSYLQYQLFVSPNEWNQWVATIEARLVQTWKENGVAELLWKREVFLSNECCSRSVSSTVSNVAWSSKGKILLDSFSKALGSESKIGYSSTHKSNASITGKKFYVNIAGKTKNNSNGKDRVFFSTSNLPSRSKKMNSIKNLNFFRSKKIEDVEMAECCQDNSSDSITVDICTQPKRGRALVKLKQSFSSLTKMAGNGTTTCNQFGKKPRICNEREYIELSSPIYSTTRRAFNSTNHSKSSANIKSSSTSSSGVMSDSQTIVIM